MEDGNCDLFDTISKEIKVNKKIIRLRKNEVYKISLDAIISKLPPTNSSHVKAAAKKGVSSWLTCLPLEEHGFILNKKEFSDAMLAL